MHFPSTHPLKQKSSNSIIAQMLQANQIKASVYDLTLSASNHNTTENGSLQQTQKKKETAFTKSLHKQIQKHDTIRLHQH